MSGNRKWTPQDDEDLIRLADSGFCLETIAEVLGWSLGATRGHLAALRQALSIPQGATPVTSLISKPRRADGT